MNKRLHLLLAVFAAVLLGGLVACSSQQPVAGTGSSAGNGRVECLVTDYEGGVFPSSKVVLHKLIITENNDSVLGEWQKVTDENGRCSFDSLPDGSFAAQCEEQDSGIVALTSKIRSDRDSTVDLILERTVTLKGRLLFSAGVNYNSFSVFIPGLGKSSGVDAEGFYVLAGIPVGQHDISFRYGATINYLPVSFERSIQDTIFIKDVVFAVDSAAASATYSFYDNTLSQTYSVLFRPYETSAAPAWYAGKDFGSVKYYKVVNGRLVAIDEKGSVFIVLDHFNDGDSLSCLHPITGHSGWLVVTDAKDGGNTKLIPDGTAQHFAKGITDINAWSGKSFNATFLMGTNPTPNPYAYVTCEVAPRGRGYVNLTNMTEFSFYLMGKGNIRVVFRSHKALAGYAPGELWGQMSIVVACPPAWQKITIYPADIKAPTNSKQFANGLTWAAVRDSVDRIEFAAWQNRGDTVSMALDDITLHGISDAEFK